MAIENLNEVILDKVRGVTTHDLATNGLLFRLTSVEDSSLQVAAEGEELVDAVGSPITTLYRAEKATYSASNSLISLDLAAAQWGSKKEVATSENKFTAYTYEMCTVADGKIVLSHKPSNEIKEIHTVANGEINKKYVAGAVVSDTEFTVNADTKTITVPTGVTGKIFVEYTYETDKAVRIINKTSDYPEACQLVIYAIFRDKCNENIKYAGTIISKKAKLNPEQVELALTSTGKHPFEFKMNKDYCDEDGELFTIIIAE